MTEQLLALLLTGLKEQLAAGVNVPVPPVVRFTVPAGGVAPAPLVSLTVEVQVTPPPTTVGFGVQLTVVDVVRMLGVKTKLTLVRVWPFVTLVNVIL